MRSGSRHQQVLFGLLIMAEFSVHAADIDMAEVEVGVVVQAAIAAGKLAEPERGLS